MVLGSDVIAWFVARTATIDARAFVPSMMLNNCGNMGLPMAYLTFGDDGLRTMVVLFITSNLLMFTIGTRYVRGSRYQRLPQQVASIVLFGNLASMMIVPIVVARAMAG